MITFDYYRIFYYVATCHSFTKAAEVLHNSQPNIMRYINNLEADLNCKLFVRGNHGVKLTPTGRKLFEHVAIAMEQLTIGEEEIRKELALESGLITIGASETALRLLLLQTLESFREAHPGIHTHISNDTTPQAIQALSNGTVDFAVVTTPLDLPKSLRKVTLTTFEEIPLVGAKQKNLAQKKCHLAELHDVPYISLGPKTGTRNLYVQYFLNHDLTFRPELEAATTDQILPMIQHNLGIGFYPKALAGPAIARGEVYPINLFEPLPMREVCLILDRTKSLTPAAQMFVTILCESFVK